MHTRSSFSPVYFVLAFGCLIGGLIIEDYTRFWRNLTHDPNAQPDPRYTKSKPVSWESEFQLVEVRSPLDSLMQKAYFYPTKSKEAQPLVVSLHSWSSDYTQLDSLADLCKTRDINYIHPDFRGVNRVPKACCSDYVISDIDAAIDYALTNANVDPSRIYVIGRSGGGYATLATFMKSRHQVKKFSAWVPLTDLLQWYEETKIRKLSYTDDILACTHSENGQLNTQVALERSPYHWDTPVEKLATTQLSIYAGVNDGLEGQGPIPITQSINFYNKVLEESGEETVENYVSDQEKLRLLEYRNPLGKYGEIAGRKICLVKESGNVKLTVFAGGHEMLERYALDELLK